MKSGEYESLPIPTDLCASALDHCIHLGLPAAWKYNLHVHGTMITTARGVARLLSEKDNPFVPHFNILVEPDFKPFEWCIEVDGVAYGSCGP